MAVYDLEEQEKLDALRAWWKDNRRVVLAAVMAFVATLAGVQGWRYFQQQRSLRVSELYGQLLEGVRAKEMKKVEDAVAAIMKDYASSGYAPLAALTAAKAAADAGNLAAAKTNLMWAAEHAPDAVTRDLARLRLAAVLLDEKRYEEALQKLDGKHAESMLALYAEMRGDVYTAQGKVEEARAAYRLALEKLPLGAEYRNLVQLKLDALGEPR